MKHSSIGVSKKGYSVFFTTAVNGILHMSWERTGIASIAAAFSILFIALGKWRQSVLKKDETAVKKKKQITKYMIMGAQRGMVQYMRNIHEVARRLDSVSKSLSQTAYDWKKVVAVQKSLIELQRKNEEYTGEMKWVKQLVIESIIKPFD